MADDSPAPTGTVEILDPQMYPRGPANYYEFECWSQQRAYESDAPELLYSGILGCGKTRGLVEKGTDRADNAWPARVAMARLHREHIGTSILPELRKVVSPSHWEWGYHSSADGGSTLYWPNGSLITLLGIDNVNRWQSTEWDMILVEQAEELDEEHWDFITGRCRNVAWKLDADGYLTDEQAYQQTAAYCNPDGPSHFLYRKFSPQMGSHRIYSMEPTVMPWGEVVAPGEFIAEVVCAQLTDNRVNLSPAYLRMLARKTGRYFERMVLGLWVAFEGVVYGCWDPNASILRSKPKAWAEWGGYPPPSWERLRGVDFGFHPDPFVFQWWVRTPNGDAVMYREIYMRDRITSEHAKTILREEEKELAALRLHARRHGHDVPEYLNIVDTLGDHDADGRATLEQEGVIVANAVKERSAGIQTMHDLLTPIERGIGGRPVRRSRLIFGDPSWTLVERDDSLAEAGLPTCTIEEVPQYRWNPDKPGKTLGADHGLDTARYIFHSLYARKDGRALLI